MPPRPSCCRARSFPLARFGVGCHIVPVDGLLRGPCTCPDLGTFFRKILFQHIFFSKMRPESVLAYRRKSSLDRCRDNHRKSQRVGTSGYQTPGSRGAAPALFLPISREKWGPPPGRRAPRGAAPRGTVRAPTTCRVRTAPTQRGANHKRTAGNPAVLSLSMGLSEAALTPPPGGSPLRRCREPPWCRRGPGWRRRPGPGPGPPPRWPPQRPPGRPRCR